MMKQRALSSSCLCGCSHVQYLTGLICLATRHAAKSKVQSSGFSEQGGRGRNSGRGKKLLFVFWTFKRQWRILDVGRRNMIWRWMRQDSRQGRLNNRFPIPWSSYKPNFVPSVEDHVSNFYFCIYNLSFLLDGFMNNESSSHHTEITSKVDRW